MSPGDSVRDPGPALESLRAAVRDAKFTPEERVVERLLASPPYDDGLAASIERDAARIVSAMRADRRHRSVLDRFLSEYGLSDQEGIALMCLAESLLRVPDRKTADRLIADKLAAAAWSSHLGSSGDWLVSASTWALMLTGKIVTLDQALARNPGDWLRQLVQRLGEPVIQGALRRAMHILGDEFVFGRRIEQATERSGGSECYTYDMLGESARDAATAQRYFETYGHALEVLSAARADVPARLASVSVKLSALHPRYEYAQRERVLNELGPRLTALCERAAAGGIDLTVDAEESDRLELSLDLFERLAGERRLQGWPGLGFVVQAYGKRALPVIDWAIGLARATRRRIPIRLVKGAYWDTEIKRAQALGYPGFPVFTRKPTTDLSYLACARKILDHPDELAGQFATHNAHTVAAVRALASASAELEFQRLHGMGESLYRAAADHYPGFPPVRVYAPVGSHEELLAYLVRRLLENGANTSFVHRILDENWPPERLAADPVRAVRAASPAAHPGISAPRELFGASRANSPGLDLTDPVPVRDLQRRRARALDAPLRAAPIVSGRVREGPGRALVNPANRGERIGECLEAREAELAAAVEHAVREQPRWDAWGAEDRALCLERTADRLEADRARWIALLGREAGKTLPDAVAELREAIDFCRYYASQARILFSQPVRLPGPSGESNRLALHGRGVFVCISPWNFPLAIFVGQIAAALAAGNAVLAKPAEETPLVAFEAVRSMHAAGVPVDALHLIPGGGDIGAALVAREETCGVAFTGSGETARSINRALAARPGPIAPLIAETGGQNAMLVDSTALLEQVTDDVVQSAFGSAGQRCSSLRVLYLQEEIAERAIELISGAMDELRVGDPGKLETDVGPIISESAAALLRSHIDEWTDRGALLHAGRLTRECGQGSFVPPTMLEISSARQLDREHFGPVLHVIRFASGEFEDAFGDAMSTGFGLTLGIHSRIAERAERVFERAAAGNVYVNRNMIGAVVGSQPFGGQGLSGTGPKAGGPHYLPRFASEKVCTVNTAAAGGSAELLALDPRHPGGR